MDVKGIMSVNSDAVKVLMVNRPNAITHPGGDAVMMQQLKAHASRLNPKLEIEISFSEHPSSEEDDLVHVFNLLCPYWTLPQIESIQQTRSSQTPILLTPTYWDMGEEHWANNAVKAIFTHESAQSLPGALAALAEGRVEVGGLSSPGRYAPQPSVDKQQQAIVGAADYLLPGSLAEMQRLVWSFGAHQKPFMVVPAAVSPDQFAQADPERFIKTYGIEDFVLCVGRLEPRKNQLLLLYALRESDLSVVLIGASYDTQYGELCHRFSPKRTSFLEHTEGEMLFSAFAAARVHVLPSWLETPGIASLEAALCDCSIVVGDRGTEWEYFQDCAYYCNPADVHSIREAVLRAYDNHGSASEQNRRARLKERILKEFTWEKSAQRMLEAYETAMITGPTTPTVERRAMTTERKRKAVEQPVADEPTTTHSPRYSIIVVTYNSVSTLSQCTESLLAYTPEPYELIFIDNASNDGTRSLLGNEAQHHPDRISVIFNDTNIGFAAASNQGITTARGKYLILLNPDTVVSRGWLERMTAHFEREGNEDIGAVGPTSNFVAGLQRLDLQLDVDSLPCYSDGRLDADRVAQMLTQRYDGGAVETKLLIGFCLALRREAVERIGLLDETLVVGNEDLDYSLRLRNAGYRLLVAQDAFVYHHGQTSFGSLDPEARRQRTQESTDALYAKLERQYGEGQVPTSTELWGIDILGIPTKKKTLPTVRLALIYDNTVRPDTTGEYCKRTLERLCHVTHYLPDQLHHLSDRVRSVDTENGSTASGRKEPPRFDVYLRIDDGLDYAIPKGLTPSAVWVIDTHIQYERKLELAKQFDYVFAAQKDGMERLRSDGIANVRWLSLACDPQVHHPHPVAKVYNVCFVGNTFRGTPLAGKREHLLELLRREFPNHFIGRQFFQEMALTYSRSRVVFNCSVRNDINMRVFEALACGSLLVTNDLTDNGQNELFTPGVHLVTYQDENDLVAKIRYYLDHPDERETIAAAGQQEALARHTYQHRMETVLRAVGLWKAKDSLCDTPSVPSVAEAKEIQPSAPATTATAAEDSEASPDERVSIIILCCNELKYTELCLESLFLHTDTPYELILVDNGSTDGTANYLDRIAEQSNGARSQSRWCRRVVVIRNEHNLGFPKGVNQGLEAACGKYLLLLNNDTILTEGWLSRLKRHADSSPEVGLVGAVTNYAADPQQVNAAYQTIDEMHAYARQVAETQCGKALEWNRLVGFCLLIKREVIDRIGSLDEQFGLGFFDDDDLSLRARQAGYRLIVAQDVFIHHFGSRTFQGLGIDAAAHLDANFGKFQEKWGEEATRGWLRPEQRPEVGGEAPHAITDVMFPETDSIIVAQDLASDICAHAAKMCDEGKPDKAIEQLLRHINQQIEQGGAVAVGILPALQRAKADLSTKLHPPETTVKGYRLPSKNQQKQWQRKIKRVEAAIAVLTSQQAAQVRTGGTKHQVSPDKPVVPERLGKRPDTSATGNPMPVSLCMIVRNEEHNLATCLRSVLDLVDEISLVDTGSTDGTKEVAVNFGAKVKLHEFPWIDSFAAARNESLCHAAGDWILWMDADDRLDETNRSRLRSLLHSLKDENAAYTMKVVCLPDPSGAVTAVDHVKLFRNHPEHRFTYRVHEQILPALRSARAVIHTTDIEIHHSGYLDAKHRRSKLERDHRLIELDLQEHPNDPFDLFNLGLVHFDLQEYEACIRCMRQSIDGSDPADSQVRKCYAMIVHSCRNLNRTQEALQACREGRRHYPEDPELLFHEGLIHFWQRNFPEAEACFLRILEGCEQVQFSSLDIGIAGYKTRHNLAAVYCDWGKPDKAEAQWRQAIAEAPQFVPAWLALGELLLGQRRSEDVKCLAKDLLKACGSEGESQITSVPESLVAEARMEGLVLLGRSYLQLQEWEPARQRFEEAICCNPQALSPRVYLSHLYLQTANLGAAEETLKRILALQADHAPSLHNLGGVFLDTERFSEAVEHYQRALDLGYERSREMLAKAQASLSNR